MIAVLPLVRGEVRSNLVQLGDIDRDVRESAIGDCLRIFRNEYTIKGGCDNTSMGGITSLIMRE